MFLDFIAATCALLPSGRQLDEPCLVDPTIAHALAERLVEHLYEMYGKDYAVARSAAHSMIGVASQIRHIASAEPLPSSMNSEVSSVLQSRPPAVFTAPLEEPSIRSKPESSKEQRNLEEVRHFLVMPEEELFKNGRPYRTAGLIERLLFMTCRFTKFEVTLYDFSPAFILWVLAEHGSMMARLIININGFARWDRL